MRFLTLVSILLPLGLLGCGGNEGPLMQGGAMNSAQAKSNKALGGLQAFVNASKLSAATPTPPGGALPGGVGVLSVGPLATAYDNCKRAVIANDADADGDGIRVHVKLQYDCQRVASQTTSSTSGKLIGTVEEIDLDDTKDYAAGGYSYAHNLLQVDADPPGAGRAPVETKWKGSYSAKIVGATLVMATDFEYAVKGDHAPVAPSNQWTKLDWSQRTLNKTVYTPDNINTPFTTGSVTHSGLYRMEGSVGPDTNGRDLGNLAVTFNISSVDLKYDNGCAAYYRSGSLSFTDGSANELKLIFECTGSKAYFNGQLVKTY